MWKKWMNYSDTDCSTIWCEKSMYCDDIYGPAIDVKEMNVIQHERKLYSGHLYCYNKPIYINLLLSYNPSFEMACK